jgi:uroporphyrin-III C-methyltransferase/precorrin-2 dehydrogenase/sirohydrochlorin ferrochelatase
MPARIGPLSVLPVFLDLAGKRVVVAGGSDAAAWKAELLAAAGATVAVYAPDELSDEMRRLAACQQRIVLNERCWTPDDLAGAAVALADAADEAEAATFQAAVRTAGVPCNVIDRPAFCDFQFGAIVNRSPVVVGISTAGAAPILGQVIRRRIEALLPPALAEWAALARRLRDRVAERLTPGAQRRAFWERFVDRVFGPAPAVACEREVETWLEAPGACGAGHVAFVGAGPGDPELLTLKAVRALQAADVIVFDGILPDAVLELARREARRIAVDARPGRHRRSEIHDTMAALARAGRRVVRLVPGDPAACGGVAEAVAALGAAGIGCEIVPGIGTGAMPSPGVLPIRRSGALAMRVFAEARALRRA